jgi:WD40 repeat protein
MDSEKATHGHVKDISTIRHSFLSGVQKGIVRLSDIKPRITRYVVGGHADWVRDIALTPDGKFIVTGSDDHTARMWDFASLTCIRVFSGHTDTVRAVAIHPYGKLLATGGWDRLVKLWCLGNGTCGKTMSGHDARIRAVAFSPDGRFLFSASEDKTVRKWNTVNGECLFVFRAHGMSVRHLVVSPDGNTVYSADEEGAILGWDAHTGLVSGKFEAHTDEVFALSLSKSGTLLFSAGKDAAISSWNTNTHEFAGRYAGHRSWVMSLSLSADDTRLASADLDGVMRVWDIKSGACVFTHGGPTWVVNGVRFCDSERTIVFASEHRVGVMDAETGCLVKDFQGHDKNVAAFVRSPETKYLATSSWDGVTLLWDYNTGSLLRTLARPETDNHGIISLCFSDDGLRLITGSDNGYVTVWNMRTGKCMKIFHATTDNIHGIVSCPDPLRIVIACRELTDNIRIYDISTGRRAGRFAGHSNTVFSIDVSADGSLLASGSADNTARIWDLKRGICLMTLTGHADWVEVVRFSRDGSLLATGGCDSVVRVWEVKTGKLIRELRGFEYSVYSLDISDDNSHVIGGGNDKTLRVWNVETGACIREYRGNDYQLYKAVITHDCSTLISGGKNSIRAWNLFSSLGCRLGTGHVNAVCAMQANLFTREIIIGSWEYGSKKISLDSGTVTMRYKSSMSTTYAVALSHSGEKLVTGGRSMLTNLLDAKTGKQLRWFEHKDNVNAVALGVRGDVLYTASSDSIARKWDTGTSICASTFEGHTGPVTDIRLTKDELGLFTSSLDSTVRKWDAVKGTCLGTCNGHSGGVNALALSWDERTFASGSKDGSVRIWDASRLSCIATVRTGVEVTALAYGAFDETILIGCDDGGIRIYCRLTGEIESVTAHTAKVSSMLLLDKMGCMVSASYDGTLKFWSFDSRKLRATFHNLDSGFLWTTPPDSESCAGWVWTDRPELIGVIECEEDGADPKVVAGANRERDHFLKAVMDKKKVLDRINGIMPRESAALRKTHIMEREPRLLP